jgi:RNA polymerase sigma-70 factor (ECF subfamily)
MTGISVPRSIESGSDVGLAAAGDELAFARLISRHSGPMTRVAFVIAGEWDTAHEAVQNAWALAWRKLPSLRDLERLGPWLVAVAANETRTLLRRARRRSITEIEVTDRADPQGDSSRSIDLLDLRNALARLDPQDRSLIALRYGAGLDSTQIAAATGGSASGVRTRLSRILGRLRRDLDHD